MAGDEIMIKTIVRSNPGYVLLKNGVILGKWSFRDFPQLEHLDPNWSELIGNASAPQDEETQLLMEAGVFEDLSFDMVDFDHFMPALLLKVGARDQERAVVLVFVLSLLLVFILSGYLANFTIFK